MGGCRERLHGEGEVGMTGDHLAQRGDQRATRSQLLGHHAERRVAIDLVDHRAGQTRTASNPTSDCVEQHGMVGH